MKKNILKEFCTPDRLYMPDIGLNHKWHRGCYPFINTVKGIIYGGNGESHDNLTYKIISKITNTPIGIIGSIEDENYYYDEENNNYVINDCIVDNYTFKEIYYFLNEYGGTSELASYTDTYGRIWPNIGKNNESYISLWLNQRIDCDAELENGKLDDDDSGLSNTFNVKKANHDEYDELQHVPSSISDRQIDICIDVFNHFNCDLNNSFIAIGDTILPILKLHSGEEKLTMSDNDMKKMDEFEIIHNLPPEEKHEKLKGWMNAHNAVMYKKLAYRDHDGNIRTDKEPMTLAQYHSLIYQENKMKKNIIENTESEEMVFQHGSTPHQELSDFTPKVKPLIMYKQFKLRLDKNGENITPGIVYPLYVNTEENGISGKNSKGLQIGKWYKSGEGECWLDTDNNRLYTKGKGYGTDGNTISKLSYRPGWHLTTTPWGNQRGGGKVTGGPKGTGNNYRFTRDSEVWAKLEICVDINATEKARAQSTTPADQCLDHLEDGEYYEYRTNSNATKDQTWYIVDKIRIIDVLDDDTVDNINDNFYGDLSKTSGRKLNSDPMSYTTDSGEIPYWKMPRENGKRYSQEDIRNMGYNQAEPSKGKWEESKKSKKTIKENMEQYNEFILEWKRWVIKESEALQGGDLNNASEYHMLANEAYKRYSNDKNIEKQFESKTFGELKTIFENNLVTLFKDKSNIIKEYTNLIKEDKNLKAQHYFFTALENFREGSDAKQYVSEAFDLVTNRIDYKTINESNKKVNKLLAKYRNELNREIDDDFVKLCENCNYVLTHKKKISNLNEMNAHFNEIISYATSHAKPQLNESINTEKLIEDYNDKFGSLLNEEEKTFVQEIMDAKKNSDNVKQKKLFEKFKNECLTKLNVMISESNDTEKEQLLNIKEQLLNKEFCAETLVKDMAKLLEMRDVLMS